MEFGEEEAGRIAVSGAFQDIKLDGKEKSYLYSI